MKKYLFHFMSLFLFSFTVVAQEVVPFNGLVKDILGKPIKKVKVYADNPKLFTFTNKKGQFGLSNVDVNDTLHLYYMKRTYDIPLEGRRSMSVILADAELASAEEDDELINLGIGYVKKREYTSAHNGLQGDLLVKQGFTNIIDAICALVPGVSRIGGVLTIRGVSSLNLSNEPLYVVDGVAVSSLDIISIHEVEKIDVLKDGSMYGVRGANGVIVVTTKGGRK